MESRRGARDAGEVNLEDLPWLNLFNSIIHSFAEVKMGWFKFQGFVLHCRDLNGFCDRLCRRSFQDDISGGEKDGHLDEGTEVQHFHSMKRVIGENLGLFIDLTLITFGIHA